MRQPPVPAFDGDSRADLAGHRHGTGQWFVANSSDGTVTTAAYGDPAHGDVPIPGRLRRRRAPGPGLLPPSTGEWHMLDSGTGRESVFAFGVGALGDMPVPADYNGDGRTDLGAVPHHDRRMVRWSAPGCSSARRRWETCRVPADYDGDGKADIAVYRTSTGDWFIFGLDSRFPRDTVPAAAHLGDVPVPGRLRRRREHGCGGLPDLDRRVVRLRIVGRLPGRGAASERHTSATCRCRRTTTATAGQTSRCTERPPASGSASARLQAASVQWRSAIPRSAIGRWRSELAAS